jgi:hypothetical protein
VGNEAFVHRPVNIRKIQVESHGVLPQQGHRHPFASSQQCELRHGVGEQVYYLVHEFSREIIE